MLRLFADMGFRWKMALPILLLAVLLLIGGTLGRQGIFQVADSNRQLTTRYLPAIDHLLRAEQDLYQSFVAERNLVDEAGGI
ncbi:hypothetical protein [Pseudomonas aeruginosa]